MERTYLHFNIANWITVILMVALGYLVFALVSRAFGIAPSGAGILPGGFPGASLLFGGATAGASPLTVS